MIRSHLPSTMLHTWCSEAPISPSPLPYPYIFVYSSIPSRDNKQPNASSSYSFLQNSLFLLSFVPFPSYASPLITSAYTHTHTHTHTPSQSSLVARQPGRCAGGHTSKRPQRQSIVFPSLLYISIAVEVHFIPLHIFILPMYPHWT